MVAFQGGSIYDMSPLKWGSNKTGVCPGPSFKPSLKMMKLGEDIYRKSVKVGLKVNYSTHLCMGNGFFPQACL